MSDQVTTTLIYNAYTRHCAEHRNCDYEVCLDPQCAAAMRCEIARDAAIARGATCGYYHAPCGKVYPHYDARKGAGIKLSYLGHLCEGIPLEKYLDPAEYQWRVMHAKLSAWAKAAARAEVTA